MSWRYLKKTIAICIVTYMVLPYHSLYNDWLCVAGAIIPSSQPDLRLFLQWTLDEVNRASSFPGTSFSIQPIIKQIDPDNAFQTSIQGKLINKVTWRISRSKKTNCSKIDCSCLVIPFGFFQSCYCRSYN